MNRATTKLVEAMSLPNDCGRVPARPGIDLLYRCAKSFQGPQILGFFAAQDVALAVGQQDAEIGGAGRVPAVLHFGNVEHLLINLHLYRALVAFVPGIALHADSSLTHSPARLCGSRPAPHSTPRPRK